MPPLFQQPATTQQAYSTHKVEVISSGTTDAPMILPFATLYDTPPGPGEVIFCSAQKSNPSGHHGHPFLIPAGYIFEVTCLLAS